MVQIGTIDSTQWNTQSNFTPQLQTEIFKFFNRLFLSSVIRVSHTHRTGLRTTASMFSTNRTMKLLSDLKWSTVKISFFIFWHLFPCKRARVVSMGNMECVSETVFKRTQESKTLWIVSILRNAGGKRRYRSEWDAHFIIVVATLSLSWSSASARSKCSKYSAPCKIVFTTESPNAVRANDKCFSFLNFPSSDASLRLNPENNWHWKNLNERTSVARVNAKST